MINQNKTLITAGIAQSIIIFVAYSIFLYPSYNCDVVNTSYSYETLKSNMILGLQLGRPMMVPYVLWRHFIAGLPLTYAGQQGIIQVADIILLCAASGVLYRTLADIRQETGCNKWIVLVVLLAFINPFLVENYAFMLPSGLAILFMVLALRFYFRWGGYCRRASFRSFSLFR